jgi:hypothetical protein
MVQDGIVSLDADGGFATVVKRAWPAAVRAYSKARYDPAELARALAGYSAGRGADGDPRVALNDARFTDNWRDLPDVPDGAALWALRGRTEISHLFSQDRVDVKFFVEVLQAVDCLRLTLLTDGRCVPADRIPAILRDMEETLVREAAPGG